MTGGRRRDGPKNPTSSPGGAGDGADGARVHGAWTTPAVVVRGPDGRVVDGREDDSQVVDGQVVDGRGDARQGPDAQRGARRPRVRPRRIPGAPGAVLLTPTLLADAADDRAARRRRRQETPVASVTPLPPRRRPASAVSAAAGSEAEDGENVEGGQTGEDGRGDAAEPARRLVPVRGAPTPGRVRRVAEALAGVNFDRLLPPDDEARARRALRLRRSASLVASVGLVAVLVYSVFPVRTWIDQRADADRAREQLEVFEEENARLEQEAQDLRTDELIEKLARELGLVMPGEELYGIYPGPEAPPDRGDDAEPGG